MFNMLIHQGNANQNGPEISLHTSQIKTHKTAGAGKNVEKEEHSSPAGGIASWYNHSGNQFGSSSENWT